MAKQVKFGMVWQCYGHQTIDLPDEIDADDPAAVKKYIDEVWNDIPLPHGEYVDDSDYLDTDFPIEVNDTGD